MKRAAAGIVVFFLGVLLWGIAIEPRFILDAQETEATVPGLPQQWEGRKVALLADFQVGMWWDNTRMIRVAVDQAIEADPGALLIAGDFLYHPDSTGVRHVMRLIRPALDAGIPVVAVLGNHDYGLAGPDQEPRTDIAAYLEAELEAGGIAVLENESTLVDSLYIVGIGSAWADRSRPAAALGTVPDEAPRVVFMHNPVAFRELPAGSAPVTFAGHTHGGQIRIPFTPSESWLDIARSREVIADGWGVDSLGAPGNRVYVNRGIGFSLVPIRIRCRPELTLVTLRAAS